MSLDEHRRCLGCGYILDGLTENRCPECGREFAPDDPATYAARQRSGRPYLVCSLIAAIAMGVLYADLALEIAGVIPRPVLPKAAMMPLVLLSGIGSLWILVLGFAALRAPRSTIRYRRTLVAAVLIAIATFCAFLAAFMFARSGGGGWYFGCGPWHVSW